MDLTGLGRFTHSTHSQCGQEGVLIELFKRLGIHSGFCVDIGARDGYSLSNTRILLDAGWNGVLFECDQAAWPPRDPRVHAAAVTRTNVDGILTQHGVPTDFDLLNIDIDGQDYWVWKGVEAHHPRVVCIEFNASLTPDKRCTVPEIDGFRWDGTGYFGASFAAMVALGEAKGYRPVCQIAQQDIVFVDERALTSAVTELVGYTLIPRPNMQDRPWVTV